MTFVLGATWLALNVWVAENLDVLATIAACGITVRTGGRRPVPATAGLSPETPQAR